MSYIAILETGVPPDNLSDTYGTYADMFAQHLAAPNRQFRVFRTLEGELPDPADHLTGVVITGSPAGVYEDHPWITSLIDWLKGVDVAVPVVGICFGHQVMAQAWGGHVEKSKKGWGVGLHEYTIHDNALWRELAETDLPALHVAVTHQDQVVKKPDAAIILAGSEFTPHGALYYTDRKAISFQCHPEFCQDFAGDLLLSRRGTRISEHLVDQALESLKSTSSRDQVLGAISKFLAA
ncbi:type 1 glutamine amidotransferase [Asticcacaulis sp. YBE204]|uniref:type 1 glutamine amidotransferase n=1 Tax=Asticcacaulis sp. YBE204 TaxID=1282363 RepID=UPI0003C3C19F|nr:type 1 glutamine amidotransferase [Asticcacaulis sp. YBE204]ESQ77493.1 glutamine amidotransferase [Asticcacaulis sp. YBE204]